MNFSQSKSTTWSKLAKPSSLPWRSRRLNSVKFLTALEIVMLYFSMN